MLATTSSMTALSIPAPAPAHATGANMREELWNDAYEKVRAESTELVVHYEKILSTLLGPGDAARQRDGQAPTTARTATRPRDSADKGEGKASSDLASQENIISRDPVKRREQMKRLVDQGLEKTNQDAKLKGRLGTTVNAILAVKDVVDKATEASPQAALAWVGVCFGLQILLNPVEESSSNRAGIAYVVSRMRWYWGISDLLLDENTQGTPSQSSTQVMKPIITEIYTKLLLYQIKSVCYYNRHRCSVFVRGLFKLDGWKAELNDIKESEGVLQASSEQYNTAVIRQRLGAAVAFSEKLVARLDTFFSAIQKQGAQTMALQEKQVALKEKEMAIRETKAQNAVRRALSTTNPRHDKTRIEDEKGGLLDEAWSWILQDPQFRAWFENPESHLLWINGDPGKGKTMIMCGIINELGVSLKGHATVAYFFCQAGNDKVDSTTAVLRGLIRSLIDQHRDLISHIQPEFESDGNILFEDPTALTAIFKAMLRDPSLGPVYLVVDALDECSTDLSKLLTLIASRVDAPAPVHWIVSSRGLSEINSWLRIGQDHTVITLEQKTEEVAKGVLAFIKSKVAALKKHRTYPAKVEARVLEHFITNSDKTFLWVALVSKMLEPMSSWQVTASLAEFPSGLDKVFKRMVNQVQSSPAARNYWQVLGNAMVAHRPLSLLELAASVEALSDVADEPTAIQECVRECGSFLTVRENAVYFIHNSARQFLLAYETEWSGDLNIHYTVASRALQTMKLHLKRDLYRLVSPDYCISAVQSPISNPLAPVRYSCLYWVKHVQQLQSADPELYAKFLSDTTMVQDFLESSYLHWIEALSLDDSIGKGVTMMAQLQALVHDLTKSFIPGFTNDLHALVADAYRFIMCHWSTIEKYPLQVYISALLFSPVESRIAKKFSGQLPKWIKVTRNPQSSWSPCLQTLEVSKSGVGCVALSPCSSFLVCGGRSATTQLWDINTSSRICDFEVLTAEIYAVTISGNSQLVATVGSDNAVQLWVAKTGDFRGLLTGHTAKPTSLDFSFDSKKLISAAKDRTVKTWDLADGKCVQTHHCSSHPRSVAYSHDTNIIAVACVNGSLYSLDTASGNRMAYIEAFEYEYGSSADSVAISYDSQLVAANGSWDDVRVWQLDTGELLHTMEGHSGPVKDVKFSPTSDILASASMDASIKIWKPSTGVLLRTLTGHSLSVESLSISLQMTLASSSIDGTVKLWQLHDAGVGKHSEALADAESHVSAVELAFFAPDGNEFVSRTEDGTLSIWSAKYGTCTGTIDEVRFVRGMQALSPGANLIAAGLSNFDIDTWDIRDKRHKVVSGKHKNYVICVAISPDSSLLASSALDNSMFITDVSTGEIFMRLDGHEGSPPHLKHAKAFMFAPDSRLLAAVSGGGFIHIWDMSGREQLRAMGPIDHSDEPPMLAFSQDSKFILSMSLTMRNFNTYVACLRIWDLGTGECSQAILIDEEVSRLEFVQDALVVQTALGVIRVVKPEAGWLAVGIDSSSSSSSSPGMTKYHGAGVTADVDWITWNGKKLVRLPVEYRAKNACVANNRVGIGLASGNVLLCSLSELDNLVPYTGEEGCE